MINRYDEKITRRLFFSMIPIQILLVMCGGINVIIDSAFASNLIGSDAMAVTGLYGPLAKVLDTVNTLIFCGSQLLCGKYLGENTVKRAKGIFTLDMMIMTIIGAVSTLLFCFTPDMLANVFAGSTNPLHGGLVQYLKGLGPGVIPFLLGTQLTSFLQLEKKEKLGYIGIAGMFISNSICDYTFIKILGLDVYGLGLATTVSNWVYFIILAVYFISGKAVFSLDFSSLNLRDTGDILVNGLPAAGTQFMLVVRGILLNNLIFRIAMEDGLAAFTAVSSFGYIYWAVPAGITSAFISLASIYTGEGDRSAIELLLKIYLKKALLMETVVSVILAMLCYPLTNLYFHDPSSAVYMMTMTGFIIFPLSSPLSAIIVGMRDLWRCMKYQTAVTVLVIADGIVGTLLMSYVLAHYFGMLGIWLGQFTGGLLVVLAVYILAWIHEKKMPLKISSLCCYPEGFGVSEDSRLNISIHSMEEVMNISQSVIDFCKDKGIDNVTSFRAGLCVEELAGNIVKHGFTGKANSVVDISVIKTEEGLQMKFKDNCRHFNPEEIDAIFDPEDPVRNIGIRIVRKVCRSMEYYPLLGLNVLTIKM